MKKMVFAALACSTFQCGLVCGMSPDPNRSTDAAKAQTKVQNTLFEPKSDSDASEFGSFDSEKYEEVFLQKNSEQKGKNPTFGDKDDSDVSELDDEDVRGRGRLSELGGEGVRCKKRRRLSEQDDPLGDNPWLEDGSWLEEIPLPKETRELTPGEKEMLKSALDIPDDQIHYEVARLLSQERIDDKDERLIEAIIQIISEETARGGL